MGEGQPTTRKTRVQKSRPDERKPLWRYIPVQQFTRPRPSARETARKGFLGLRRCLGRSTEATESAVLIKEELQSLPDSLRDQIAPIPDWTTLQGALDETFRDWLAGSALQRLPVVIAMPGSGQDEALSQWAGTHDLVLLHPPPPEQILAGASDWLSALPQDPATRLVMPSLARCYLRHADGLRFLRQFLDWLANWPGRCLLGCSSWAWAYLSAALHIDRFFTTAWTLEALDAERLQIWFAQLASGHDLQPLVFREPDSGHFVIPPPALKDENEEEPSSDDELWGDWKQSSFLTELAAHSLGNPGVAWAIWRISLGQLSAEETEKHALREVETVWVKPWRRIYWPTLPNTLGHSEFFVLHTLLLHDGLAASLLCLLLPLSAFEVRRTLSALANLRVLEVSQDDIWRVSPLAYHTVREALADEGFLVGEPG